MPPSPTPSPQPSPTPTPEPYLPSISINDVSVTEGNSGTVVALFTVRLSAPSAQPIAVNYATADHSAVSPSDYMASSGTLTFAPGVTSQVISVTINGDIALEENESFFVSLSGATNAKIIDSRGLGTIVNDDASPLLAINDVSVTEGNSGTVVAFFTVRLSAPSAQPITVNYATANNTAVSPSDYVASSATLTFAPGDVSKIISVSINGDIAFEHNETFFVNLSASTNATIADPQGLGTIINDDVW